MSVDVQIKYMGVGCESTLVRFCSFLLPTFRVEDIQGYQIRMMRLDGNADSGTPMMSHV